VDLLLDGGHGLDAIVEHNCELFADVRAREGREATASFAGQDEIHVRPAILIVSSVSGPEIAAAYG